MTSLQSCNGLSVPSSDSNCMPISGVIHINNDIHLSDSDLDGPDVLSSSPRFQNSEKNGYDILPRLRYMLERLTMTFFGVFIENVHRAYHDPNCDGGMGGNKRIVIKRVGMFAGVIAPVTLGMLSQLFLRVGK